ncbi:hypothetical protein WDU94_007793 [Cyamophila willieti]
MTLSLQYRPQNHPRHWLPHQHGQASVSNQNRSPSQRTFHAIERIQPAPLDLSAIALTPKMEELVDQLAENTHNLWAKERIQQGWTYGLNEDPDMARSPHLVPYSKVDDAIKKANRDTASETVRTLLVYGYNLDPPTGEQQDAILAEQNRIRFMSFRTYRAEKNYAVSSGKWYFEFEILTAGPMRVGWARVDCAPGAQLGSDEHSWAFDGFNAVKVHAGLLEIFGRRYQINDVVGVFLDLYDRTISFSLNGELLMDALGGETTFADVQGEGFVPACTLGVGQRAKLTFGQDVNHLKYFSMCGLQEGYEPFCVNMKRAVTYWYTRDQPIFENTDDYQSVIDVTRIPAGSDSPPCLKISHNTFETMEKANWEFLRLSLPVSCMSQFIDENEKQRRWKEIRNRQQILMMEAMENTTPAHIEQIMKSGFSMSDIKGKVNTTPAHIEQIMKSGFSMSDIKGKVNTTPAHIEQIMKSGFSMSDIKGKLNTSPAHIEQIMKSGFSMSDIKGKLKQSRPY